MALYISYRSDGHERIGNREGRAYWTPNLRALKLFGSWSTSCCLIGGPLGSGAMASVTAVWCSELIVSSDTANVVKAVLVC
jgi:hypothetical protein